MKVTVIVPVYNVEKYLARCLDSLAQQTLPELEVLVVNDGSPDHSQEIIDRFAQEYPGRIIPLRKENGGLSSARNFALDSGLVQGEYIGFCDSDDWVDTAMFETMYKQAKKEQADIVVCDTVDHYPDGRDVVHHPTDCMKFRQTPSAVNKLYRRELVGDLRFPDGLWYEDLFFTGRLFLKTDKIAWCHQVFTHIFCRDESIMRNNNAPKNLDIITIVDGLIEYAAENGYLSTYAEEMERIVIDHILITSINRVALQEHPDKNKVIKQMRTYVRQKYPRFRQDSIFQDMPRNRRIIARLNAAGMHSLSKWLLKAHAKKAR